MPISLDYLKRLLLTQGRMTDAEANETLAFALRYVENIEKFVRFLIVLRQPNIPIREVVESEVPFWLEGIDEGG